MFSETTQKQLSGFRITALLGAVALATLLAFGLSGCSSASSSKSGAGVPSASAASDDSHNVSSSSAKNSEISVNVILTSEVGTPEQSDTPIQFSEESINVLAPKDATALEVLKATGREVKTVGQGEQEKVVAIGGLENGAVGETSHWAYAVNNDTQLIPASNCKLKNGETLTWKFVA